MPWPPSHRCRCWTWQRPHRLLQRRDLRPHGAGLQRRPLRRKGAPCPGLLRTGARAGPGTGLFGRFNGGTHGYTMRGYNGVLFGESAHRALATDAQMQVSDLAAASSASSAARPTATQCWTTTTSSSAKGRTVPWPPSNRCRCWTWQRLHRLFQRLDLRLHGAGLQRRPLWRRDAQCARLLRTDAGAGPGNGLIGCFSSRTFGKGARRALASFTQLHRNSRRLHRRVRRRDLRLRSVGLQRRPLRPPSRRCRCWTWRRHHPRRQRRVRPRSAGLQRRLLRQRGATCLGLIRTSAGAGPRRNLSEASHPELGNNALPSWRCTQREIARWGLRGVRIGEASHPGPAPCRGCGAARRNPLLPCDGCGAEACSVPPPPPLSQLPDVSPTQPPPPPSLTPSDVPSPISQPHAMAPPETAAVGAETLNATPRMAQQPPPLRCPLCTGFSSHGPPRCLTAHLTRSHSGHILSEHACHVLHGLDRGVCEDCGALRALACRKCPRCQATRPPRPPRSGDRLPTARPGRPVAGPQDSLPTLEREDLADFIDRVERLPAATVVHIPVDQRERHACLVAGLLDRMAAGDEAACALERARSKLLRGPVP